MWLVFRDGIAGDGQVVNHPSNELVRSLAWRLLRDPQLKVLNPIVVPLSVLVVDVLPIVESAPDVAFHDFAVLKNSNSSTYVNDSVSVTIDRPAFIGVSTAVNSSARSRAKPSPKFVRRFEHVQLAAFFAFVLDLFVAALYGAEQRSRPSAYELGTASRARALSTSCKKFPATPFPIARLRTACSPVKLGWRAFKSCAAHCALLIHHQSLHPVGVN